MKKTPPFFLIAFLFFYSIKAQLPSCFMTSYDCNGANPVTFNYPCPDGKIPNIQGYASYNSITASGDAYIKYATTNTNKVLKKIIVLVEGLDLGCNNYPDRNGDIGYPNLAAGVENERDASITAFQNAPTLLADLALHGYDFIYLDFKDGAEYMQANAMVVVKLLIQLQQMKQGNEPIVVVGASMGGQVAKYALSYMEQNNLKHCTSEYVSWDSPHQGANIPLGLQALIDYFSPVISEINDFKLKLNRPAPLQLLVAHSSAGNGPSSLRQTWLNDLNALGNYPKKTRNVAIANGSSTGDPLFNSGQLLKLEANSNSYPCHVNSSLKANIWTVPANGGKCFEGERPQGNNYLQMLASDQACVTNCPVCFVNDSPFYDYHDVYVPSNTPLYDNCPGGKRNSINFFANMIQAKVPSFLVSPAITLQSFQNYHSFIPTMSSLDINGGSGLFTNVKTYLNDDKTPVPGKYPFEAYYAPQGTSEEHVEVTGTASSGNIGWLLQELAGTEDKLSYDNYNLTYASPLGQNYGKYNYGRFSNRLLKGLNVSNGGILYVNANLPTDFGYLTPGPAPSGSSSYLPPPINSTFNLETCNCNNVTVTIDNNGQFILGESVPNNKAIVTFHAGSTLLLLNNSKLTLNASSQLIIEAGAKLEVDAGAKITINDNAKIIVQPGGQFVMQPNTEVQLKGSNSMLDVQDMNTAINLVSAGDQISFNNGGAAQGGTARFAGGYLAHSNSAQLIIDNCTVLFDYNNAAAQGMNYFYDPGADIQLVHNKSVLELRGDIYLGPGVKFTFGWPSGNSHGYFKFSRQGFWGGASNPHIHADVTGGTFELIGNGYGDKMMEIAQETVYMPDQMNFMCRLVTSKIEFTSNTARLQVPCDYDIHNTNFICPNIASLTSNARGLALFGQSTKPISNCRFVDFAIDGIDAGLIYGGNKLYLTANTFQNSAVNVYGAGAEIKNCNFNQAYQPLNFYGSWFNNNVTNCIFASTQQHVKGVAAHIPASVPRSWEYLPSQAGNAHLNIPSGISAFSGPVLLNLDNCSILGFEKGVDLEQGVLNVHCGNVNNNDFGFFLERDASIHMSTTSNFIVNGQSPKGGYVNASDNGITVFADAVKEIDVLNGYNNLKPNIPGADWGTITIPCFPHCSTTYQGYLGPPVFYGLFENTSCMTTLTEASDFNAWKNHLFNGSQYRVDSVSTVFYEVCTGTPGQFSGDRLYFQDPSEMLKNSLPACGGGGPCTGPACKVSAITTCTDCSSINTSQLGITPSNNAAGTGDSYLTTLSAASSKNALSLYADVLKSSIRTTGSNNDKYVNHYAHKRLHQTMADAFEQKQIPDSLPSQPDLLNAIQALDAQITPFDTTSGNYRHTFYTLMEKGQLYRMARLRQDALSSFNAAAAIAKGQKDKDYVNKWICLTTTEITALNNPATKGDYFGALDSCSLVGNTTNPASSRFGFAPPAQEANVTDIRQNYDFRVYPNPGNGEVFVAYSFEQEENREFVITDVTGTDLRLVFLQGKTSIIKTDCKDLAAGIYFYTLKENGKALQSGKLIITR